MLDWHGQSYLTQPTMERYSLQAHAKISALPCTEALPESRRGWTRSIIPVLTLWLVSMACVNAYTPMPAELPANYPNQNLTNRHANDVSEGVKFDGTDYTLAVSSSENFVVMQVPAELNTLLRRARSNSGSTLQAIKKISSAALSHFDDQFDFVILTHNEALPLPNASYLGVHYRASNEVAGIGRPLASQAGTFGSAGFLKSVIHLPVSGALRGGPSLHEIMHRWGNSLKSIKGDRRGHWGYTSVDGVLGGFDLQTLQTPVGLNGEYQATGSGSVIPGGEVSANGYPWNNMAYSPLEQYLMGARAAERIRDIVEIEGVVDTDPDDSIFTGTGKRIISISDIIEDDEERLPAFGSAQNSFRTLYVVVTARPLEDADWSFHNEQVSQFSLAADDGDDSKFNFWEATEGFATMSFSGLTDIVHESVPLTTDFDSIRVTSFKHRLSRIEVSEENNYWLNAIISQTGAETLELDGMRFGLVGQNGTGSEFVRCGSNWVPFDFPAGYVIETGRIECVVEEPGTYQTVAQVRVGAEWIDVFNSESYEVFDIPPANVNDLQVDGILTGPEPDLSGSTLGERHWASIRFTNTAARDLELDGLRSQLIPLDGQAVDPVCSTIAGTVIPAGEAFNSGKLYCPELFTTGRFAISFEVAVDGIWNQLDQSDPFTVEPPPVTSASDVSVDFTFVSDPDAIVAGQVDNVQIRARYINGGFTDAVFESMSIQILSADGVVETSCFVADQPVTVKPSEFFSTGTISCPTLNNVGTFDLSSRFRVNAETNAVDDIFVNDVELSDSSVQVSTNENFSASASIRNSGRRSVRIQSVRFRLLDLDENAGGREILCYESNQARTIAAAGVLVTGSQTCTLANVGNYQFVVDIRIDDEWYEKYRSASISVVAVAPVCVPPASIGTTYSSGALPRLLSVAVADLVDNGERVDTVVTIAGRTTRRSNPNLASISDYWVGIKAIRTSDDNDVQFEPIRAPGNIGREGVSESMVIPPDGAAAWNLSFCNTAMVDIDIDFTTRVVNLNLAQLLLDNLSGVGRIRHDKVILLSSRLSAIPAFAGVSNLYRRAVLDVRAGRGSVASRRMRAAASKLGLIYRDPSARLAVYQAFRSVGIRLGRRARGESVYQAYSRALQTASRSGALQAALTTSFENLERLLNEAVSLSGDSARRLTVRTIGQ